VGRFDGKVVLITGAARGQGRSHAIRFAEEGADIIAIDIATQIQSVPYGMATRNDLDETVRIVEHTDRRIVAYVADVRNYAALKEAVDDGVAALGRLDVVCANAGIFSVGTAAELSEAAWRDMLDVNLTGVWHTAKATIPHLRAAGGGSLILTSSTAGIKGTPNVIHYVAAKHGVVGVMKTLALELAADNIRVNSVHPTTVNNDMVQNAAMYALFAPELPSDQQTAEVFRERVYSTIPLPIPWVESSDVTNAVVWLASDEGRYITGVMLPVDGGATQM
jgi:SDR family mycofactocin-dependent oxidoreductase